MDIKIKHLREIARLSKKPISELRKINVALERAYIGKELTKYQLIYQIVFHRDAPSEHDCKTCEHCNDNSWECTKCDDGGCMWQKKKGTK